MDGNYRFLGRSGGDWETRDVWLYFMIVRILFFGVFLSASSTLLVNLIERKMKKILKINKALFGVP